MSYTKQTWATGDTITADKLNHIEAGIAAASYYDEIEKSVVYFDKHDLVPVSRSGMPTGVYALSENDFPLDTVFDNDELKITLNSEEFTVQKQFDSDMFAYYYGTNPNNISDKDADPFTYIYSADENDRHASFICIGLAANSTVDLKIEGVEFVAEPTDNFKKAVNASFYSEGQKFVTYFDEHNIDAVVVDGVPGIRQLDPSVFPENLVINDDTITITVLDSQTGINYWAGTLSRQTIVEDGTGNSFVYYGANPYDLINGESVIPITYTFSPVYSQFFIAGQSTYDVKIEGLEYRKEPTNEFKEAVKAASSAVSPMVIRVGYNQLTCDKTGAEVFNAISNGIPCFLIEQKMKQTLDGFYYRMLPLIDAEEQDDGYHFTFTDNNKNCGYVVYVSSTSSPYLTYSTTENDR